MQQEVNNKEEYQEVISMEEYLTKRKVIREKEQKQGRKHVQEKSPAWILAELYV